MCRIIVLGLLAIITPHPLRAGPRHDDTQGAQASRLEMRAAIAKPLVFLVRVRDEVGPPPDELAQEIADDLQAAREQFAAIAEKVKG